MHDSKSYNAFVSYRLREGKRARDGLTLRLGVNNLFDATPPLTSASNGYDPAVHGQIARGRSYSLAVTKKL